MSPKAIACLNYVLTLAHAKAVSDGEKCEIICLSRGQTLYQNGAHVPPAVGSRQRDRRFAIQIRDLNASTLNAREVRSGFNSAGPVRNRLTMQIVIICHRGQINKKNVGKNCPFILEKQIVLMSKNVRHNYVKTCDFVKSPPPPLPDF